MSVISAALASLGLSPEEISRKSKIPVERVAAIMGGASVRMSEVRALSSGLRVSKHFLSPRGRSANENALRMLFRSTEGSRDSDSFDFTVERVSDYVDSALSILPARSEPPTWFHEFPEVEESFNSAKLLSIHCRILFFDGDISSPVQELPSVISNLDGLILSPLKESRFEGISLLRDNYVFVFISPRFIGRMLFTLAHELGHVIAHHSRLDTPILESATSIGNFRKANKSERFVDAFASCLLLPDDGVFQFLTAFRKERNIRLDAPVGDIEVLLLARFFGVSFDVAAHRCEDLKILPKGAAFSLSDHLKKHHGSPEKRANELALPPRNNPHFPALSPYIQNELERQVESGELSIGWAADRFGLSLSELMEMHRVGPNG